MNRSAKVVERMSATDNAEDPGAPHITNHPGGMMIKIPNTEAGRIGPQDGETEMADRHERGLPDRSVGEPKDRSPPKLHRSRQTKTQMQ